LNYLDDLLETQTYFQNNFRKNIRDYKFIPNVGLAVPLNDLNVTGKLFCFLPLPIPMPFSVSVHGYFAVGAYYYYIECFNKNCISYIKNFFDLLNRLTLIDALYGLLRIMKTW
jgi:hypothetical protein